MVVTELPLTPSPPLFACCFVSLCVLAGCQTVTADSDNHFAKLTDCVASHDLCLGFPNFDVSLIYIKDTEDL